MENTPTLWNHFVTALKTIFLIFCFAAIFEPVGCYHCSIYFNYHNNSRSHFPVYTGKKLDSIPKIEYFKLPSDYSDVRFVSNVWSPIAIQKPLPEPVRKHLTKQRAWYNHRSRMRQILGY